MSSIFWWQPRHKGDHRKSLFLLASLPPSWQIHLPCYCHYCYAPSLLPRFPRLFTWTVDQWLSRNPLGLQHHTGTHRWRNYWVLGLSREKITLPGNPDHIMKANPTTTTRYTHKHTHTDISQSCFSRDSWLLRSPKKIWLQTCNIPTLHNHRCSNESISRVHL